MRNKNKVFQADKAEKEAEKKRTEEARIQNELEIQYMTYPDVMIIWKPEADVGLVYSIDKYDKANICTECSMVGAYQLAGDPNAPGICRNCLFKDDGGTTIDKLIDLPKDHKYQDAECVVSN